MASVTYNMHTHTHTMSICRDLGMNALVGGYAAHLLSIATLDSVLLDVNKLSGPPPVLTHHLTTLYESQLC